VFADLLRCLHSNVAGYWVDFDMECAQLFLCGAHSQQLFEPQRVLESCGVPRKGSNSEPTGRCAMLGGIAEDYVGK
jgi:hypothetical protein